MGRRSKLPKPRLYLEKPKSKEMTGITMYYFYDEGKVLKYSTGEEIEPKYWDQKKQRVIVQNKRHEELDVYLSNIKSKAVEVFKEHGYGKIAVDRFRFELDVKLGFKERTRHNKLGFFDLMGQMIEAKKKNPKTNRRGTWKVMATWYAIFLEYSKSVGYRFDYEEIDSDWFHEFEVFCFKKKNHSINYVHKGATIIKQVMNEAKRKGFHESSRFESINPKKIPTNKVVLYFDELEKIYAYRPQNDMDWKIWINIFVGCFTGMRFGDWQKVKKDLIKDVGGRRMIEVFTQKTSEPIAVPFLDVLENVLELCNYEVPPVVSQVFNRRFKVIGKEAGITEKIHWIKSNGGEKEFITVNKYNHLASHVCRRSFASNFTLIKCPPSMLMPITGHKSERQFREYVNISGRQNAEAFAKYANLYQFEY